jgi:hypothetical protein
MWKALLSIMRKRGYPRLSATLLCTEQRLRRSGKQWARGDDAWGREWRLRAVDGPHASLLDALMDEPCHATRHTSHTHDMPIPTQAPLLASSPTAPDRLHGRRGWACMRACEQTLTALPACCMHCKAWQHPRLAVDVCVRCVK